MTEETIQSPVAVATPPVTTPPPASGDTPPVTPATAAVSDFKIPDEYKDKSWVTEKIKSAEDLWKTLDNAQSLIGKKSVVPDFEKATPKEIEDYYSQIRPKDKAEYKFSENTAPEEKEVLSDILYKSGLSAHQANNLISAYDKLVETKLAAATDETAYLDMLKKEIGDSNVIAASERILIENLNGKDKEIADAMPNQFRVLLNKFAANIHKVYGASESGKQGEGDANKVPEVDTTKAKADIRKEIYLENEKSQPDFQKLESLNKQLQSFYNIKPR